MQIRFDVLVEDGEGTEEIDGKVIEMAEPDPDTYDDEIIAAIKGWMAENRPGKHYMIVSWGGM